jgi:uncharacterized protein YjiS (DUF1127 family)
MAHLTLSNADTRTHDTHAGHTSTHVAVTPRTLIARLRHALAVRRERRALACLCARMRDDIGLSQADIYREATRTFLDVPALPAPFERKRG